MSPVDAGLQRGFAEVARIVMVHTTPKVSAYFRKVVDSSEGDVASTLRHSATVVY